VDEAGRGVETETTGELARRRRNKSKFSWLLVRSVNRGERDCLSTDDLEHGGSGYLHGHAFLGTTNLNLSSLTERFQTRFQSVRLQPPENEVLAAFLARRWAVPISITRMIAEGAAGNVRAAMADLEMWMG
jgi:hypothetical protein